jgi:squalene monooxygenase
VYGYALYKNGRYACVKYPVEGHGPDVAGRSFHHGRFVQRLRYAAAGAPGVTAREATVRRLLNGAPRRAPGACVGAASVRGEAAGQAGRQAAFALPQTAAFPRPRFPRLPDRGLDWSEGEPVSGVQYRGGDGSLRTARAHLTVVCDGMYSQFRWGAWGYVD